MTDTVAWLITNRASGVMDLAFEPLADLPFNQERFICEPLAKAGRTSPSPASAPSPAGGVREAAYHDIRAQDVEAAAIAIWQMDSWRAAGRMRLIPWEEEGLGEQERFRGYADAALQSVRRLMLAGYAALSSPATPEPVSAPAGVVEAVRKHVVALGVGCCSCGIKSPDRQWHAEYCKVWNVANALDGLDAISNPAPGHGEGAPLAWQSMDSAPKDGTHVLLAEQDGAVSEARWLDEESEWWRSGNDPSDHWGEAVIPAAWQPMPLYFHPATGEKEGRS